MAVKVTKLRDGVLIAKRTVIHLSHAEAAELKEALDAKPMTDGHKCG